MTYHTTHGHFHIDVAKREVTVAHHVNDTASLAADFADALRYILDTLATPAVQPSPPAVQPSPAMSLAPARPSLGPTGSAGKPLT